MAVRRDKNTGEPIEELTRKFDTSGGTEKQGRAEEKSTRQRGSHGRAKAPDIADAYGGKASVSGGAFSPFEAPTKRLVAEHQHTDETDRTRLIKPESGVTERSDKDPMADPVVGWLVVVSGPGKGQVCKLGYGSNSLGRGESSRVRFDFGDDRISRDGHAMITYDTRGRRFYLQHGGGKNLTYLGEDPVLVPTMLEAMQEFSIGNTKLRFVPLCGPEFEWEDTDVG